MTENPSEIHGRLLDALQQKNVNEIEKALEELEKTPPAQLSQQDKELIEQIKSHSEKMKEQESTY